MAYKIKNIDLLLEAEKTSELSLPVYAIKYSDKLKDIPSSVMDVLNNDGQFNNDFLDISNNGKAYLFYSDKSKEDIETIINTLGIKGFNEIDKLHSGEISDLTDSLDLNKIIQFTNKNNVKGVIKYIFSTINKLDVLLDKIATSTPKIKEVGNTTSITTTSSLLKDTKQVFEDVEKVKIKLEDLEKQNKIKRSDYEKDLEILDQKLEKVREANKKATTKMQKIVDEINASMGEKISKRIKNVKPTGNKEKDKKTIEKIIYSIENSLTGEEKSKLDEELVNKAKEFKLSKDDIEDLTFKRALKSILIYIQEFRSYKGKDTIELEKYYTYILRNIDKIKSKYRIKKKTQEETIEELKGLLKKTFETKMAIFDGNQKLKSVGLDPDQIKSDEDIDKLEEETDKENKTKDPKIKKEKDKEDWVKMEQTIGFYTLTSKPQLPLSQTTILTESMWTRPDKSYLDSSAESKSIINLIGDALDEIFGYQPEPETMSVINSYRRTREALYQTLKWSGENTVGTLAGSTAAGATGVANLFRDIKEDPNESFKAGKKAGSKTINLFAYELFGKPEKVNPELLSIENNIRKKFGMEELREFSDKDNNTRTGSKLADKEGVKLTQPKKTKRIDYNKVNDNKNTDDLFNYLTEMEAGGMGDAGGSATPGGDGLNVPGMIGDADAFKGLNYLNFTNDAKNSNKNKINKVDNLYDFLKKKKSKKKKSKK
jgi:hypothetical protein